LIKPLCIVSTAIPHYPDTIKNHEIVFTNGLRRHSGADCPYCTDHICVCGYSKTGRARIAGGKGHAILMGEPAVIWDAMTTNLAEAGRRRSLVFDRRIVLSENESDFRVDALGHGHANANALVADTLRE
jgi:hypothetical protein